MRSIDLTGKEFTNLKVLYRAESSVKNGKIRGKWHCKCKCGNEFDVLHDNLIKRPDMSCRECSNKNRAMHIDFFRWRKWV